MKKLLLISCVLFLWAGSSFGQITVFPYNQDFSDGAVPTGWSTAVTSGIGTTAWLFDITPHSDIMLSPTAANGYASFNAPALGTAVLEATLTSPVFDFTGKTIVTLEFYHLLIWSSTKGYVEYSIDGGSTWTLGAAYESQINPSEKVTLDLSTELGSQSNVRIRWRGVKTTTDNYWENWSVDDVKVSASSFIVDFSANPTVGTAPLTVTFTHSALPAGTYTYAWDFGDGDDSTDENPSHTYTTDGVYTVALSVTNTVTSETVTKQKDDLIIVVPFSGNGTQADPFLIATMGDLNVLSGLAAIWDKYFELTADIDAEGTETDPLYNNGGDGFSPIGSLAKPFNGNFDGKGFVISNLYINANFSGKGLFGYTKNTQIRNLGVIDAEILGTGQYQGILIGDDVGTSSTVHSVVENCFTTGSVSGGSYRIGGFIGDVERTEIKDSYTISSVSGQQSSGTFVGYAYYGVYDNCYAQGSVYASHATTANVGGFIGASYGDKITNCYATAAVTSYTGATEVGGFAGLSTYSGVFNGCYWDTETTGQATSQGPVSDYYKGLTTVEFSDENNFMEDVSTSWDFTTTWKMEKIAEDNVVRPRLTWQELSIPTSWTGDVDNNWHEAGNWDSGIPASSTDVTVAGGLSNYPTISSAAVCNNLMLSSGASILDAGLLTVNGTVTAERDYSGGQWHMIGSPVSGETANTFYGIYLQSHYEVSNEYSYIEDETTELVPGQGYALWNPSNATAFYSGSLTSSVTKPLTRTVDGFGHGWNLVSNPYPSSIDWESASGWTKTNVDMSTYCYDGAGSGNWAVWNGTVGTNGATQYIASGQGFFVSVSNGQSTGSLGFSMDIQIHHNTAFFKNDPTDIVKLKVSGNNYSDEMAVYFREEASIGYDGQMDAHQLPGIDNLAPYIYSSANEGMAVNVLPEVMPVPMNVKVGSEMGTFTIESVSNDEFSELYLEDLATGAITDLNENLYSFVYIPGIESRFVLHFSAVGVDNISDDLSNIYSYNKDVYVTVPINTFGIISIYDMVGREVISSPINKTVNIISLEKSAYYIVKVLSDKNIEMKKIFIN